MPLARTVFGDSVTDAIYRKGRGMPRQMGREVLQLMNGYQPDNLLYREGPVVEEFEDGAFRFEVERERCSARWTDGHTSYYVGLQGDGRWRWYVSEFALDLEDDWNRHREGVEDTYEQARSHLSSFVVDPDHAEVVSVSRFEEFTDEEMEEFERQAGIRE